MSNILLIEDNEAIIMGLEYLFTNNGYNVRVARSAYQAKEILDNAKETEKYRTLIGAGDVWNIDIVILDVMLPDGDGFSLCRKIKADDIAPVIFLTAKDEEKDVVMGLELGADDYVIKPEENHSGIDPHADVPDLLGGTGYTGNAGGQEKGTGKVSPCPPMLEGL